MENLGIGKLHNFVRFSCYSPRAGKTRRDSSRDKNNMVGVVRGKKRMPIKRHFYYPYSAFVAHGHLDVWIYDLKVLNLSSV